MHPHDIDSYVIIQALRLAQARAVRLAGLRRSAARTAFFLFLFFSGAVFGEAILLWSTQ